MASSDKANGANPMLNWQQQQQTKDGGQNWQMDLGVDHPGTHHIHSTPTPTHAATHFEARGVSTRND